MTSWPSLSSRTTKHPNSASILPTVLLPLARPPVRPTRIFVAHALACSGELQLDGLLAEASNSTLKRAPQTSALMSLRQCHRVSHQHGDRQRTNATGNRGVCSTHARDILGIRVANELVPNAIDADVDHDGSR